MILCWTLLRIPKIFVSLDKVFLDFSTKNLLNQRLENSNINQQQSMKCLTGTQAFYQSALGYVLKKIDMSETLWVHASWTQKWESSSWDILNFVEKLKSSLQLDQQEKKFIVWSVYQLPNVGCQWIASESWMLFLLDTMMAPSNIEWIWSGII